LEKDLGIPISKIEIQMAKREKLIAKIGKTMPIIDQLLVILSTILA
jgi:hypothetical protein